MESSTILDLIDQLDDDCDDLEECLAPLIQNVLSDSASKLPLLDKAKLYILVTYAIESLLFSYLRINGVKARDHPVFRELTRVKQYFDKVKDIETPAAERTMAVDKAAATRFIKAGLAGNDKYDLERAEREAKERARAHIKFEQLNQAAKMRKLEGPEPQNSSSSTNSTTDSSSESSSDDGAASPVVKSEKQEEAEDSSSAPAPNSLPLRTPSSKTKAKKLNRKRKAQQQEAKGLPKKAKAKKGKREVGST